MIWSRIANRIVPDKAFDGFGYVPKGWALQLWQNSEGKVLLWLDDLGRSWQASLRNMPS